MSDKYEECSDPVRLAEHRARHGDGSVDGGVTWRPSVTTDRRPAPLPPGDDKPHGWSVLSEPEGQEPAPPPEMLEWLAGDRTGPLPRPFQWSTPAPDLPPGVTRCTAADGTEYLTALGRDVPLLLPGGWKWLAGAEVWAADRVPIYDDQPYVVRPPEPPAEPRTERVSWWAAPGRRLPHGELVGPIDHAYPSEEGEGGMYVEYALPERDTTGNVRRNPDGTVEVLADTDGEAPQ